MPKRITSTSKRWAGSVTIADPLTIPQAKLIEAGMGTPPVDESNTTGRVWLSVIDDLQLPAIFACVEKWELDNMPAELTIDTFPASPRGDSHKLIEWLFKELVTVYFGEAIVPNE